MTTTEKKTVTRRKRQGRQYAAFIRFGVSADELALIDTACVADGRSTRTDYCRVHAVQAATEDATRVAQLHSVRRQAAIFDQFENVGLSLERLMRSTEIEDKKRLQEN